MLKLILAALLQFQVHLAQEVKPIEHSLSLLDKFPCPSPVEHIDEYAESFSSAERQGHM